MKLILQRLKEPSTWDALGGLAVVGGMTSEDWVQVSALGAAVASFVLGFAFAEKGEAKTEDQVSS